MYTSAPQRARASASPSPGGRCLLHPSLPPLEVARRGGARARRGPAPSPIDPSSPRRSSEAGRGAARRCMGGGPFSLRSPLGDRGPRAPPLSRLLSGGGAALASLPPAIRWGCGARLAGSPFSTAPLLPGAASALAGWGASGAHAPPLDANRVLRAVAPTDEDEGSCGARSSERKQDGGDTGTERAEAGAVGGGKSGGARPEGSSGGACGASEVGTRDSREPWLWEERWTDTPYAWAALMACHCFAYAIATASVFPHGYAHVAQGVRSVFTAALGAAMALQTAVYVSDPGVITPNEDVDPAVRAFVAHSLDSGDRYYTWRGSGGGNDGADKMGAGEGGGGVEPPLPSECANFRRDASGDIVRCVRGRDGAVEVHKYCAACNVWRPPHAAHCRDCNVCVRRLDHHCGAMGTCIGAGNQRFFLGFLGCGSTAYGTLLYALLARMYQLGWPYKILVFACAEGWLLPLAALATLIMTLALGLFVVAQVLALASSVTTRRRNKSAGMRRGDRPAWIPGWSPSWVVAVAVGAAGACGACRDAVLWRGAAETTKGTGVADDGSRGEAKEGVSLWDERDSDDVSLGTSSMGVTEGSWFSFEAEHPLDARDCAELLLAPPCPRPRLPSRRRRPPPGLGNSMVSMGLDRAHRCGLRMLDERGLSSPVFVLVCVVSLTLDWVGLCPGLIPSGAVIRTATSIRAVMALEASCMARTCRASGTTARGAPADS